MERSQAPRAPVTNEKRFIRLGGLVGDAFGNPIVEVEGPFADDFSNLPWEFKDHRDGETATYRAAGYLVKVYDMDGDAAEWVVKHRGTVVSKGDCRDFFTALATAEAALRAEARLRSGHLKNRAERRARARS